MGSSCSSCCATTCLTQANPSDSAVHPVAFQSSFEPNKDKQNQEQQNHDLKKESDGETPKSKNSDSKAIDQSNNNNISRTEMDKTKPEKKAKMNKSYSLGGEQEPFSNKNPRDISRYQKLANENTKELVSNELEKAGATEKVEQEKESAEEKSAPVVEEQVTGSELQKTDQNVPHISPQYFPLKSNRSRKSLNKEEETTEQDLNERKTSSDSDVFTQNNKTEEPQPRDGKLDS